MSRLCVCIELVYCFADDCIHIVAHAPKDQDRRDGLQSRNKVLRNPLI